MADQANITSAPGSGAATDTRNLVTWSRVLGLCVTATLEALGASALVLMAVLTVLHPDHPLAAFGDCTMEASR